MMVNQGEKIGILLCEISTICTRTGQNIFPNHDSGNGETPPVRAGNIKIGDMAATQRERINFSKIKEVIDFPNLIEIQKKSYAEFLQMGADKTKRAASSSSCRRSYRGSRFGWMSTTAIARCRKRRSSHV